MRESVKLPWGLVIEVYAVLTIVGGFFGYMIFGKSLFPVLFGAVLGFNIGSLVNLGMFHSMKDMKTESKLKIMQEYKADKQDIIESAVNKLW